MELVQDFMPVLVICKLEEDPIKIEGAIVSTTFFPALNDLLYFKHCSSDYYADDATVHTYSNSVDIIEEIHTRLE